MTAREELDAAWREWQNAILYLKWKRANPGEALKLDVYRQGGPRPELATATGRALVNETAAWLGLAPTDPDPPPTPGLGSALYPRLPFPDPAKTVFAALTGSDSNDGGPLNPVRTVQKALSLAGRAGMVLLRGGNWPTITVTGIIGDPALPQTVAEYPGDTVTVTGSDGLSIRNSRAIRFEGLHVRDVSVIGFRINNSEKIELCDCSAERSVNQAVLVGGYQSADQLRAGSADIDLYNLYLNANGPAHTAGDLGSQIHGIYYGSDQGATRGVIANLLVSSQLAGFGVQVGRQNDGLILTNFTVDRCIDPGRYGGNGVQFFCESGFSLTNVVAKNGIVTRSGNPANTTPNESGRAVHAAMTPQDVFVDRVMGWNNLNTPEFDDTYGAQIVWKKGLTWHDDPQLTEYKPSPTSPANAKADPAYTPPFDRDGNPRPLDPALGCYR